MSAAPAKAAPVPPCSIETEQALLGALLADNRLVDAVITELEPCHFFDPLHQRIFESVLALASAGAVSPITLHAAMRGDPGLKTVGGIRYLGNLVFAAPASPAIKDYARILRDLALRRDLVAVGEGLAEEAALDGPGASGQAVAAAVVDELLRLGESRARGPSSLAAVAQRSVLAAEERLGGKPVPSLSTGLVKLDRALGGMQPGDRIGIPGRTGIGKSLTMSAIINGAAPSGAPIFIASGDMREKQWADRALCDIDQRLNPHLRPIYYSKFRNGTLSNDEVGRIQMAQREMADWAIEIDDNPEISIPALRGRVRAMARRYPGRQGILGVDFLQKVKASGKDRRRDEDITDAAYALGDIVRDVGWTLLVLIQLKNKNTDGKGDLREDPPNVTDIRESGGVEMAMDIIMSPFRQAFFIERREPEGRNAPGGATPEWLSWWGEYQQHEHHLRMLGWKNRDGRAADLNLDLWCDPGCAAIRDEKPGTPRDETANLLPYAPGRSG